MSKEEKLYNLQTGISIKAQRIEFILKNIIWYSESEAETQTMADLALDEIKKISRMSDLIGKILNL